MDHGPTTKWQAPTDEKTKAGYGRFLRPQSPYDIFMEEQGIPIYREIDRKSTRLNSSHSRASRMPSSA